jgi:hypothetical protein
MMKLIVGFPRCGNQSHFETFGTASLHELIYDPNGIEHFKKTFPGYEPIILIRNSKLEHAFSNWCRMCKMAGETRAIKDCQKEYLEKADFEKYMKPWIEAYPDIEILKLEDLIKDPKFLHIDNFSIPHNTKNDKRLQQVVEIGV